MQGWVLLPSQRRRFGFSLQSCCWEEENPPSPCLGDGERRDKGEQLFAERWLLWGARVSIQLPVPTVPPDGHQEMVTPSGAARSLAASPEPACLICGHKYPSKHLLKAARQHVTKLQVQKSLNGDE